MPLARCHLSRRTPSAPASALQVVLVALLLACSAPALCADTPAPSLKEASLVTEVLPWGETVTALRLEYSDEIPAAELTALMPSQTSDSSLVKFHVFVDRAITNVYVNSTGTKDDVAAYGKYVFINLGIRNTDPTTYRGQVTFNPAIKSRPRLPGYTVSQTNPITTRSGAVIAPVTMTTSREICVGIDDFTTLTFTHETTGRTLNYHLYIPKGYESKRDGTTRLPLVVHYPSGDFNYVDWTGKYRGALFSHHDALYWSDDDSQAGNPAFVVTVGGPADPNWGGAGYADSEMQQMYVKIVGRIATDYPVDPSRIYAVSLAGGTVPMWSTILANPTMFAAQITTAYDPYHAFREVKAAHDKFGVLLATMPGWFFAGLTDPTGAGVLGASDTRFKGERLRDIAAIMNQGGANIEVAFGTGGELMWNGLLRGGKAWQLADAQLARARARRASHMVTLFIPGTVLVNQHWSWDATYSNAVVRRWLFEQVNDAPYVPAK